MLKSYSGQLEWGETLSVDYIDILRVERKSEQGSVRGKDLCSGACLHSKDPRWPQELVLGWGHREQPCFSFSFAFSTVYEILFNSRVGKAGIDLGKWGQLGCFGCVSESTGKDREKKILHCFRLWRGGWVCQRFPTKIAQAYTKRISWFLWNRCGDCMTSNNMHLSHSILKLWRDCMAPAPTICKGCTVTWFYAILISCDNQQFLRLYSID